MMITGCSDAADSKIASIKPIKLNIVLLSFQANCTRRRKLCGYAVGPGETQVRCRAASAIRDWWRLFRSAQMRVLTPAIRLIRAA
jgi:hypothetical protein